MKIKFFLIIIIFSFFSCSKDEITNVIDEPTIETPPNDTKEINTTPCDYSLTDLTPNTSKKIDCTIDLKGETIDLPANVELIFDYGQIINGTLNFKSNGKIDGRLLNISLGIKGTATLDKDDFDFESKNWKIKEGKVSNEEALQNKINFQKAIDITKSLNVKTFKTDKLDAYFKIGIEQGGRGLDKDAIHLPSNFHLNMTKNTYLRVQPFKIPWGVLLSVFEQKEVKITGGNLIGDRFEHDYSPYNDGHGIPRNTHEWPTLITIAGSENIIVDQTNLKASTGDCLVIGAVGDEGSRTKPDALWNKNIVIKNSIINEGRRNNISVTDGENITIENNEIINTGLGDVLKDSSGAIIYNSSGTNPKYGIDIEPYVKFSNFNIDSAIKYEWVENVTIKNNTFTNNQNGSIVVFIGDNITIDGNTSDHSISQRDTTGSKIINNIIEARDNVKGSRIGIETSDYRFYTDFAGGNLQQYALNNDVINNTVKGFATGLKIFGGKAKVTENKVIDCGASLIVEKAENVEIFENTYTSSKPNSVGIIFGVYSNNVKIHHETVNVQGRYLFVNGYNRPIPNLTNNLGVFTSEVYNCDLKGKKTSRIFNAVGLHLKNNTTNTGLEIIKSDGIKFEENTVIADTVDGLVLDQSVNSSIISNIFTLSNGYDKVVVKNEPSGANNVITGNTSN